MKTELLKVIDEKSAKLGSTLDRNILYNYLICGTCLILLFFPDLENILPENFLGIEIKEYRIVLPIILIFLFVRFGFISFRFFKLLSERDKMILNLTLNQITNRVDFLATLKAIYRHSNMGEIYYKTMIYKGVEVKGYIEEKTMAFIPFTIVCIISIILVNTVFIFLFLIQHFESKNHFPFIVLCLGILTIFFGYLDYIKKIFALRKEMNSFYEKCLAEL